MLKERLKSRSQLSALLGLNSNTVGIEGDAEILAAIGLNSTNEASSMTGDAIANTLAGTIEGISVDQLDTSGEITIDSDVDADLKLLAASIEGTADAELTIDEIATLNGVLESDSDADLALSSDMSVSLGKLKLLRRFKRQLPFQSAICCNRGEQHWGCY